MAARSWGYDFPRDHEDALEVVKADFRSLAEGKRSVHDLEADLEVPLDSLVLAGAISDDDAAIKLGPHYPAYLGRGLAKWASGDRGGANEDRKVVRDFI